MHALAAVVAVLNRLPFQLKVRTLHCLLPKRTYVNLRQYPSLDLAVSEKVFLFRCLLGRVAKHVISRLAIPFLELTQLERSSPKWFQVSHQAFNHVCQLLLATQELSAPKATY